MNPIYGTALAGLAVASQRAGLHGQNIANLHTAGYVPAEPVQTSGPGGPVLRAQSLGPARAQAVFPGTSFAVPQVRLEEEIVGLQIAETGYKASAATLKTAKSLDDALFDILA